MVATSYILAAFTFAAAAFAAPVSRMPVVPRTISTVGGHDYGLPQDLGNFDDFYGSDNFHGRVHNRVIVKQEQRLVCRRVQIHVVQQRLVLLRELMKRIITRQVCEVEHQTVLLEQFRAGIFHFGHDIRRTGHHDQIAYDEEFSGRDHLNSIWDENGDLNDNDLGFSGHDVGRSSRIVFGDNWNDNSSPASVHSIYSGSHSLGLSEYNTDLS